MANLTSYSKEQLYQDYQNASQSLAYSMCTLGTVTVIYHLLKYKELVETVGITPEKIGYAIYLVICVGFILYKYLKVQKYSKLIDELN
ncbi:hypothetical protein ACT4XR_20465 (plasmid) [Acinetobacter baumannii]|uniref:hypothetical protein n=1 Tax=Acinetobacter baumannii TaxID=470 RepID=UPI003891D4AF